ncbi:MAG: NAD-dependent epimerase/dehydratase family protein, partial [Alphaproteobacteria bacterium]|nr:NAD-dependent epimerase/dehydratase family protein [Alphaproteobacteria bacterium]
MRVVITGAGGFIGKKIAERLAGGARLKDRDGKDRSVSELVLFDVMPPAAPKGAKCTITSIGGDIGNPVTVGRVLGPAADSIFHLAAVVSAGAEEDFDLGMRVNLEGTRWILEGCRTLAAPPKVVFASSVAVYGGDMPPVITDATSLNPQTSYGSQKAMGE